MTLWGDLSREQLHGERFNYRFIDKKSPLMGLEGNHTYTFTLSMMFINAYSIKNKVKRSKITKMRARKK